MRFSSRVCVCFILLVAPVQLHAQLIFQRDTMIIHRGTTQAVVVEEPDEANENESIDSEEKGPPVATVISALPALTYSVQIRSQDALELPSLDALYALNEQSALAIVLDHAGDIPLPSFANNQPVDVMMASPEGKVTRIYPSIVLSQVNYGLSGKGATKAYVLFKSGTVDANSIKPGDRIEHPIFTPPPRVLE